MPVIKPRTRPVNFRLTEEEYRHLIAACSIKGSRSISDFARSAVLRSAEPSGQTAGYLQSRLATLDQKVVALEGCIMRLIGLLHAGEHLGSALEKPNEEM
jgi:uncharacterized protein (DUF1778 family)